MQWTPCADQMPPDMHVVIARYVGWWPNRGQGGVTDLYTNDGVWFNTPPEVIVTDWMYDPDNPPES